jgi:hypothetical protein
MEPVLEMFFPRPPPSGAELRGLATRAQDDM